MATPDLHGVPPKHPSWGSVTEQTVVLLTSSRFIDDVLLGPTPRATGAEFWESKWQQGSVVPFLCLKHQRWPHRAEPLGRTLCSGRCLLTQTLFALLLLTLLGCPHSSCPSWPKAVPAAPALSPLPAQLPAPSCRAASAAVTLSPLLISPLLPVPHL